VSLVQILNDVIVAAKHFAVRRVFSMRWSVTVIGEKGQFSLWNFKATRLTRYIEEAV